MKNEVKTKVCKKCGRELPLTNDYFEKRKSSKDGFRGVCRECRNGRFLIEDINGKNAKFKEVFDFIKNNSTSILLDKEFINVDTKMNFKCECGEIFTTTFYKFKSKNKRRCNKCTGQEIWTNDRITSYLKDNSKCTLVKSYMKNYSTWVSLKCECGNIFDIGLAGFRRKRSKCCNECSDYKYYDIEMIRIFVEENSDCVLLEKEYNNIYEFMEFKCSCGEVFKTSFINFKKQNKRQCNECGIKNASDKKCYTLEQVKKYIESNSDCILLSDEYNSCYEKLDLRCACGEIFKVSFDKFKNQGDKNKTRCDICSKKISIPALKIEEFFKYNSIDYIREYRFEECKYKNTLPFDFYLPKHNACVEYDGEFHFKETSMGNNLKLQQLRDEIKNSYCKDNEIKLIRIPYWEFGNFEEILLKELNIKLKDVV